MTGLGTQRGLIPGGIDNAGANTLLRHWRMWKKLVRDLGYLLGTGHRQFLDGTMARKQRWILCLSAADLQTIILSTGAGL